ncbi:hypothetical protein [Streptomyces sp. NPDC057623]|uniref:hypothetical protein n=1 Tax=Streptomyces sp. NPDC057623 TaxID=3346187 RepID=UPI0036C9F407
MGDDPQAIPGVDATMTPVVFDESAEPTLAASLAERPSPRSPGRHRVQHQRRDSVEAALRRLRNPQINL